MCGRGRGFIVRMRCERCCKAGEVGVMRYSGKVSAVAGRCNVIHVEYHTIKTSLATVVSQIYA